MLPKTFIKRYRVSWHNRKSRLEGLLFERTSYQLGIRELRNSIQASVRAAVREIISFRQQQKQTVDLPTLRSAILHTDCHHWMVLMDKTFHHLTKMKFEEQLHVWKRTKRSKQLAEWLWSSNMMMKNWRDFCHFLENSRAKAGLTFGTWASYVQSVKKREPAVWRLYLSYY